MTSKKYFTKTLLQFFSDSTITLPWRGFKPDPYKVLISETMLQQTQVSRVIEKFTEFIEAFPTIFEVASASNEQIIRFWNGLGYNSRALRLKKTCDAIVKDNNGVIPYSYNELRSLPGIGDYTASAIVCFAFRVPVVVLDVNVIRVFSRFFSPQVYTTDVINEKEIRESLVRMLPKEHSSEFFQAIMDVARLYCKKSSPNCNECPLSPKCKSNNKLVFKKVTKRLEPSYLGFPRRIWRGRVLKIVTEHYSISVDEIVQILEMSEHIDWITTIIHLLEKDGLIEFEKVNETVRIKS
ncbi:MAG: hypothetical protein JNL36_00840 [Candidatus Kapabacteria bacterium]|nr:hypothetical protein [Candidatus Kapabacteria bacterium]